MVAREMDLQRYSCAKLRPKKALCEVWCEVRRKHALSQVMNPGPRHRPRFRSQRAEHLHEQNDPPYDHSGGALHAALGGLQPN